MAVELSLIKCFCANREVWQRYDICVREVHNMDTDIRILFDLVRGYYETYEEGEISRNDLVAFYDMLYSTRKNKNFHLELITQMYEMDINLDLAEDLFEKMMERHEANLIINQLQGVLEGDKWKVLSQIKVQIGEFERRMKNPPSEDMSLAPSRTSVAKLITQEINPEGLSWHLHTLNEAIGVLRRKTFGVEFAYSDTGKTSFATRCVAHWARQLADGECIVYAGNEEASARTELRITQSLTNWTGEQIANDPDGAERIRNERGWDKIYIFDSVTSTEYLRAIAEEYRPLVLISDQFTKVDIKTKTDKDMKILEKLANWFREFAKEFDMAVMGLTQGTGETRDKKFLDLGDMYNSRVAIQGELDWAIGIGTDTNPDKSMIRYFSIPKNKFGDHTRFHTTFNNKNNEWKEI